MLFGAIAVIVLGAVLDLPIWAKDLVIVFGSVELAFQILNTVIKLINLKKEL